MKWYELILVLIDMRSFSNLWYWIGLAVLWSSVSHWVLGVPYDMITRARRNGDQSLADMATMARINARRMLYISRTSGLWIIGFTFFLISGLGILAFAYGVELAQAVFLLFAPMVLVGYLSLRTAFLIEQDDPSDAEMIAKLTRHRFAVQLIGMVSIFVTSLFGMYQNLGYSVTH